jgi:hypothetical protein
MNGFRKIFPTFLSHYTTFFAKMTERKVIPFDEFYYQLKLMHLFQKHPVLPYDISRIVFKNFYPLPIVFPPSTGFFVFRLLAAVGPVGVPLYSFPALWFLNFSCKSFFLHLPSSSFILSVLLNSDTNCLVSYLVSSCDHFYSS